MHLDHPKMKLVSRYNFPQHIPENNAEVCIKIRININETEHISEKSHQNENYYEEYKEGANEERTGLKTR